MSGGRVCQCPERDKPFDGRGWRVTQRHCNHSTFNGNRYTPSRWSALVCLTCRACWRTTADYVPRVPDITTDERAA